MKSSFRIARVAGIEIGVHYTWLLAFALVTWSLAVGYFPESAPVAGPVGQWLLGAVGALGLFASVLIHEPSHSLVALRLGLGVLSITLFVFGGVSNIDGEAKCARDEFLIAVVGPLTSLLLAGVFLLVDSFLGTAESTPSALVGYLALANLVLGVFNLLPGFPLDGGRVLRSLVWRTTGSLRRATQIATYGGQAFGLLLVIWGVSRAFAGDLVNGLWTAFIGWFLNGAAESTRTEQVLEEGLRGLRVADLMSPDLRFISPDVPIEEFVLDYVLRRGQRALVVMEDRRVLGLVSISDTRSVPPDDWAETPVSAVTTPAPLKTVEASASAEEALRLLATESLNQLPVLDQGEFVGLIGRADVLRFITVREEIRLPERMVRKSQREAAA